MHSVNMAVVIMNDKSQNGFLQKYFPVKPNVMWPLL